MSNAGPISAAENRLSSRERVHAALCGLPVDRVPLFLWLTGRAACRLIAEYKHSGSIIIDSCAEISNRGAGTLSAIISSFFDIHVFNTAHTYAYAIGSDIILASHSSPKYFHSPGLTAHGVRFNDPYGSLISFSNGLFSPVHRPLKTPADLARYRAPVMTDEKRFNIFRSLRKKYPGASIASAIRGPFDLLNTSLAETDNFMTMIHECPDEVKKIMDTLSNAAIELIVGSVRAGADLVFIMDDYGYHGRTFLPLVRWNECVYPYLSRMIAVAHEEGALVMLHSCGYQEPFLPAYAAAGLDALHPLQGDAGNNFPAAYNRYNGKLSFATGIDIASAENSHPDDVRQDINRHLAIAKRGGFILAPTSEISHSVPLASIKVIFEAIARTAG